MPSVKTALDTVFEVKISFDGHEQTVMFKLGQDEKGSKATVCFHGHTWVEAKVVHAAIAAFLDRFPLAFEEQGEQAPNG